jgi:hypothetical protein
MSYLDKMMGENEQPVFTSHQHWVAFMIHSGLTLLTLILAIAVVIGIWIFGPEALARANNPSIKGETIWLILAIASVVILVYPLIHFLLDFFRWRAEIYVITNYRVIQLTGIFDKNVMDSSLEKVNDVVMRQTLLGRWLGYGFIEIVTGSEAGVNKFYRIAKPIQFKTAMVDAKHKLEGGMYPAYAPVPPAIQPPLAQPTPTGPTVAEQIAQLADLRDRGILTPEEFESQKRRILDAP